MANTADAILPILKKIQEDVATGFKRVDAKLNNVAAAQLEHGEKLDDVEQKMTYHLGITATHMHDIKNMKDELKTLRDRVTALETQAR